MEENKNIPQQHKAPMYDKGQILSIIKASNEMLTDVVDGLIERGAPDNIIDSVKQSIGENLTYAKNNLGATEEDVKRSTYHGASISEIKAYEDRLKRRGLTDESVRRKDIATVSEAQTEEEDMPKKERRVRGVGLNNEDGSVVTEEEYNEKEGSAEQKRRARRKRQTGKGEPTHSKEYIEIPAEEPAVIKNEEPEIKTVEQKGKRSSKEPEQKVETIKESEKKNYGVEQFNLADIPDYVQYDIIPLPSNGECYAHKKGRIPVAYLTASDENIIASPNMYRDGKLLDVILRRKILDKSINVDELCSGDRDAIILWLRATAYGDEFPISVSDRETGKRFDTVISLSSLKYNELELKGDENGHFTYNASNGDVIKFRMLSKSDEDSLRDKIASELADMNKYHAIESLTNLTDYISLIPFEDEEKKMITEDIEEIGELLNAKEAEVKEAENPLIVTEQMVEYTVSVNGNEDREFVRRYIEEMRAGIARDYRNYVIENKPGVDFNITVNRPESEGGGSFNTFLRLGDYVLTVD